MDMDYRKRCYRVWGDHIIIRYGVSADEMGAGWYSVNTSYEDSRKPRKVEDADKAKKHYFSATLSSYDYPDGRTLQDRKGRAPRTVKTDKARWRTGFGFTYTGKEEGEIE